MKNIKRIGILTSGGDAPGMNAAIRAVTRTAVLNGIEVMGILNGYEGLLKDNMIPLGSRDVSYIINRGGTMLYTARSEEYNSPEGVKRAAEVCRARELDGVIALGGDGTFRGAYDLSREGIPCIAIPCTIDNDICATDATIGFNTAVNTVVDLIDKIRDTGESHARCNVIEVMGRHAGDIALHAALAVGAISAVVREFDFDEEHIAQKMIVARNNGKRNFILIVCEGMGSEYGARLATDLEAKTGIESRFSRLGYIQRGGTPSMRDRTLAAEMGCAAFQALLQGCNNDVISLRDNCIVKMEMKFVIEMDMLSKNKINEKAILSTDRYEMKKLIDARMAYKAYLYDTIENLSL